MSTVFKVTSVLFLPHADVRFEPQRVAVAVLNALRRRLVIGRSVDNVSYEMLGERRLSQKLQVLIACCCGDDGWIISIRVNQEVRVLLRCAAAGVTRLSHRKNTCV